MHVWYIMYIVLLCLRSLYLFIFFSFIVTIVDSSEEILCSESMKSSHNVILRINVVLKGTLQCVPQTTKRKLSCSLNLKPCSNVKTDCMFFSF